MPALESLQKEFQDKLSLLAINLRESPEDVKSYVKLKNIQSIVLLDVDGSVGQAYRSDSIPMQVLSISRVWLDTYRSDMLPQCNNSLEQK